MSSFERLLDSVYRYGEPRPSRTGIGTRSLWQPSPLAFGLVNNSVPLITSKKVPWKMATAEFMWMLAGSTNTNDLRRVSPRMADLWNAWANPDGDIGPTYGAQWRNAGGSLLATWDNRDGEAGTYGVDQLKRVILQLADHPDTRRALISLWGVPELADMSIEPCMVTFHFSLRGINLDQLSLHVYQRSADMMLGVPFDLYQAGLLTHLVARELTLTTGRAIRAHELTWQGGDVHIYDDQVSAARQQLLQWGSAPQMSATIAIDPYPSLRLLDGTLEPGHIQVLNYESAPAIDAGLPAV